MNELIEAVFFVVYQFFAMYGLCHLIGPWLFKNEPT